MIDIHSHIVFDVDDGAASIDESLAIIKEEINQGVDTIICTPHFREGMFETSTEVIKENFEILNNKVKELGLPITLYLGREIFYHKYVIDLLKEGHLTFMAGTNCALIEFSYTKETDISEVGYNLSRIGCKMIVAHIERYQYIHSLDVLYDLKGLDCLIQVNASTICGADGHKEKKKVMTYIKEGLVDFVASDIHYTRVNYIAKAYQIVKRKFGEDVANDLFENNQKRYLNL